MLHIAICDDSQASVVEIHSYTESYFQQRHISVAIDTFANAEQLLEDDCALYDIFLLDVRMKLIDGLAAGKLVRKKSSTVIFFLYTPL